MALAWTAQRPGTLQTPFHPAGAAHRRHSPDPKASSAESEVPGLAGDGEADPNRGGPKATECEPGHLQLRALSPESCQ